MYDEKNVGFGDAAEGGLNFQAVVEEHEMRVPYGNKKDHFSLPVFHKVMVAFMVIIIYLITLETLFSCDLCVDLPLFWFQAGDEYESWNGSNMDWVVLGFAVVTALTDEISIYDETRLWFECFGHRFVRCFHWNSTN